MSTRRLAPVVDARAYETTAADLAALLRTFALAAEPLPWDTAFIALNPFDDIPRDARRREHKAWVSRTLCLFTVATDAHTWGLLYEAVPGGDGLPLRSVITLAGHRWLRTYDRSTL